MQFACRGTFLFWLCERETQIDEIAPAGGKSFITKWREMPHLLIIPLQYARRWHSVACLALFRPDRRPHRVLIFRRAAVQMRSWGTHHSTGNITLMLPVQSSPKERALGCVNSHPQPGRKITQPPPPNNLDSQKYIYARDGGLKRPPGELFCMLKYPPPARALLKLQICTKPELCIIPRRLHVGERHPLLLSLPFLLATPEPPPPAVPRPLRLHPDLRRQPAVHRQERAPPSATLPQAVRRHHG